MAFIFPILLILAASTIAAPGQAFEPGEQLDNNQDNQKKVALLDNVPDVPLPGESLAYTSGDTRDTLGLDPSIPLKSELDFEGYDPLSIHRRAISDDPRGREKLKSVIQRPEGNTVFDFNTFSTHFMDTQFIDKGKGATYIVVFTAPDVNQFDHTQYETKDDKRAALLDYINDNGITVTGQERPSGYAGQVKAVLDEMTMNGYTSKQYGRVEPLAEAYGFQAPIIIVATATGQEEIPLFDNPDDRAEVTGQYQIKPGDVAVFANDFNPPRFEDGRLPHADDADELLVMISFIAENGYHAMSFAEAKALGRFDDEFSTNKFLAKNRKTTEERGR